MTKEEIVNEAKKVVDNLETGYISLRLDVLITRNKKSDEDFKEIERLVSSGKALIELKTSLESKKLKTMVKEVTKKIELYQICFMQEKIDSVKIEKFKLENPKIDLAEIFEIALHATERIILLNEFGITTFAVIFVAKSTIESQYLISGKIKLNNGK